MTRTILCGLTYSDIIKCAGMNQRAAAERLGVNHSYFNQRMKRLGMIHWFPPTRRRCLSKEDIIKVAEQGLCQVDAAEALGISGPWLSQLLHEYGIRHLFPGKSKRRTA